MSIPTTREEFKNYCLRTIGGGVTSLNISNEQVEDRIDEALLYYQDYHFDGTEEMYYKYQVTPTDITNKYITLPDDIIGAVDIFDVGTALGVNNIFNIRYQIALNDLYTLTSISMVPYYMAMSTMQNLEQLLVGKKPIRYNRHVNKLYIDMDWTLMNPGNFLIVKVYQTLDPVANPKMWSDRWLQRYASCLIKQQYGTNLKKFKGQPTTGGISYNGQEIYDEATIDREKLEHEMIFTYSPINMPMIG